MTRTTIATTAALRVSLGAMLMLCMAGASAQLYKWTDADGKIHFSDTPPPPGAKAAPIKAMAGGEPVVPLPYALAQAARSHPVVLYTSAACDACESGRTLLKQRGIPFSEKTVETGADNKRLREIANTTQVPVLMVGRSKSVGFESGAWNSMLTSAAYPAETMLPKNYRYPQPASLVPPPAAAPVAAPEPARKPAPRPVDPNAPPGFQF